MGVGVVAGNCGRGCLGVAVRREGTMRNVGQYVAFVYVLEYDGLSESIAILGGAGLGLRSSRQEVLGLYWWIRLARTGTAPRSMRRGRTRRDRPL